MSTSIRLPESLLNQLSSSPGDHWKAHNHQLFRKQTRKQNRLEGKQRRAHHSASVQSSQQKKRSADEAHANAPKRKKLRTEQPPPKPFQRTVKSTLKDPPKKLVEHLENPFLEDASSSSRHDQQEDAYISYLETKLGWKKHGSKTRSYGSGLGEDGLDELFVGLEKLETRKVERALTVTEGGANEFMKESATGSSLVSDDPPENTDESEYEQWGGFDHSIDTTDLPENGGEVASPESAQESPSNPMEESHYTPPHRRKVPAGEDLPQSEALIKLNKQLKGLLNRLSEQNISSILDSIEEIYRNYRRNGMIVPQLKVIIALNNSFIPDVTSVLTTLMIDGVSSHSIHLDSYVVLYAAFVASLYRLVGVEFAAFFVQHVISLYEKHLTFVSPSLVASDDTEGMQGKEASNLIVLLSELYNFQVVSCVLMYDIIRGLLDQPHLTEFNVELLLKVTRCSGPQLRQDDPSALGDIIKIVHSKIPNQTGSLSSRTNFMIETLTSLKNNKLKKAIGGGASGSGGQEAVERLKKFLSGMSKKRHVMPHQPLRVTLEDLHSAEIKGKWWLIGASWNGDPLVDNKATSEQQDFGDGKRTIGEGNLIRLAKKQGMNTDIRRSVFVVVMSSEDYVDACERLAQLKLSEVQQREIVRVLLHCCGNEKSYNPYYTLICQQLCRTSHSYKITLQFCMWDFLRELGESNVGGIELLKRQDEGRLASNPGNNAVGRTKTRNVAKAYAWWIAKDCCTLAILKPLDFTVLKTQTHGFLKELLLQIFISSQVSTPTIATSSESLLAASARNRPALEEIFTKATRIETLALGLLYFVSEAFRPELEADGNGFLGWAKEVVKDTLRTSVDIVA